MGDIPPVPDFPVTHCGRKIHLMRTRTNGHVPITYLVWLSATAAMAAVCWVIGGGLVAVDFWAGNEWDPRPSAMLIVAACATVNSVQLGIAYVQARSRNAVTTEGESRLAPIDLGMARKAFELGQRWERRNWN